ncbi:MAG TPA: hypothetical protein VE442_05460 [Jatrophihabitans sp.]|nr:hypothetical protein [Jatrophihabitans sp.]
MLKLAFDEARAALADERDRLASVRNRATGLLAAAAVGTSFATTAGLLNADSSHGNVFPAWGAWLLLGVLSLITYGVLVVLWPTRTWDYGLLPEKLLENAERELDDVLRVGTRALIRASSNDRRIVDGRVAAYRLAASALMIEVALLVLVLIIAR